MKPILFNTEMVRAILDGRKNATRRIAFANSDLREFKTSNYPDGWLFKGYEYRDWEDVINGSFEVMRSCKYKKGDILYVRETWQNLDGRYVYKADKGRSQTGNGASLVQTWHPSIHMPREAARIFLRVTDARLEQLRPMGLDDFEAEGLNCVGGLFATTERFASLWDGTIKKTDLSIYGWKENPWVWIITFERISQEKTA